ncbi:MAG: M81 family metallopeptidase [Pseudomonadota bacterium]
MRGRVGIGGIWHETNTFSTETTGMAAFEAYQLATGTSLLDRYAGTGTELGGMIEGVRDHGFSLAPTLFAAAVPSGIIERPTLMQLIDDLIARIDDAMPLDGMLLVLHGAAVADGLDDVDGWILAQLRKVLPQNIPLVASFDCHANLSHAMVDHADMLIGYDTYPHVDMAERGREAVDALAAMIRTSSRPAFAFRKLPLLTAPQMQATDQEPMKTIMASLHSLEADGTVLNGSIALGFPYADSPDLGGSVLTYADEQQAADRAADQLARQIWELRDQFRPDLMPVDAAVKLAIEADETPVVLAEAADNVGGGSAGDGTVVLDALLCAEARDAVIVIADPEAVAVADEAGVGAPFAGLIGAKVDRLHGDPIHVVGQVVLLTDGHYRHTGSYMTGYETSMGRTAVIQADGVKIVLTSLRTMPFDAGQLTSVGIDPAHQRIIVAKSAIAWQAAYAAIAKRAMTVDTPGIATSNLARLLYRRRRKPLYPLDRQDFSEVLPFP